MAFLSCFFNQYCIAGLAVLLVYLAYKLFKFVKADADLTLLGCSLKPGFFEGKVVWVTGASSGIGEELCKQLSGYGAKLILSARSKDKLEAMAKSLPNSKVLVLDLADQDNVSSATGKAKDLFGRIDILVNNGGIFCQSYFLDFEEKCARELMETNFFGTVSLTRDVIKVMIEQGGGHIVNVSSLAGKFGSILRHYYSASKFALIGLMDAVRLEVMDKNISITNICPGPVKTNVSINALTSDGSKLGKTIQPIAEGMSVQRCAELILMATCNKIREGWISIQPFLFATYIAQYCPSLFFYLMKKMVPKLMGDVFAN